MIGSCARCGNYERDKEVSGCEAICPKCGYRWRFKKLPVYFLTGCSGVGKTTTAEELQKMTDEYVILDSDMFYSVLRPESDAGYAELVEQVFGLTKNIHQAGKSVVWTKAGSIDKLPHAYGARFVSEIKVLALTAENEELMLRMKEGRGIKDEGWLRSSAEYNAYFREHGSIGDTKYDRLDITRLSPEQAAQKALEWLRKDRIRER